MDLAKLSSMIPHRVLQLSVAGLLLAGALTAQPAPKAFDLLKQVREAYAGLQSYRDQGEIETIHSRNARPERHRFELVTSGAGGYRFTLQAENPKASRVIWRDGAKVWVYEANTGYSRESKSLLSEVVRSFGEGGQDALVVPALLAGGKDALSNPQAATVDGLETCGGGECWVLVLSREGGIETRLWVDRKDFLIRQVEARLPGGFARSRIRVQYEAVSANPPVPEADLVFAGPPRPLPPSADELSVDAEVLATIQSADPGVTTDEVFQTEITVVVAPIVVRVVDPKGKPILGLKPEDFLIRAGKVEVPVLAVDWTSKAEVVVEETESTTDEELGKPTASAELLSRVQPPQGGKWVLFFVQSDPHPSRMKGQLKALPLVEKLLETLDPTDRVALISFDSHLRLRLDWTGNHDDLQEALRHAVRFGGDFYRAGDGPDSESLKNRLALDVAKRVANPERALEVTAESLLDLPGEKVVVYLGWGLGRYRDGGVSLTPTFHRAARTLRDARATIFALDITDADFHSLEVGLESMALSTGGLYAKTYNFPEQAIKRVAQAISGYYVLTLDGDALPHNGELLRVELRDKSKKATVLTRPASTTQR